MQSVLRAVLDTNVLLAANRSTHPASPNVEILRRWRSGEFRLLYSLDTLAEYAEKLLEHEIPAAEIERFLRLLAALGEVVPIVFFHFRHYPVDADDVMFLLCALNGAATHLVSYDTHLLSLRPYYAEETCICEPLKFVAACREALP
jgi:putative PIN family toxin of toxin-antitoxin system